MSKDVGEVVSLHYYPIKSCAGIQVKMFDLDAFGPRWDRRWMIVNEQGAFFTQRKFPKMALIQPAIAEGVLTLSAPGMSPISLNIAALEQSPQCDVKVWGDPVRAHECGVKIGSWLSAFLGKECKLVFMGTANPRVRQKTREFTVGFADSRPVLLTNISSLDDLNSKASSRFEMERFRPNIVIKGPLPYEEDHWKDLTIGPLAFSMTQKCERCAIPAVDQKTGEKNGAALVAALNEYRSPKGAPLFGLRMVHNAPGLLRVGDRVLVAD